MKKADITQTVKNNIWTAHHFFISECVCWRKLDYWTRPVYWAAARWHATCKHHTASLFRRPEIYLGSTPVSQIRPSWTEILRSLTGVGSGVSVWVKEGMGASCPLEWPSHAMTLHTSGTPLITLPPSYQSLPFRLWFLPLSMSACFVLCTLTRALIHQGYITWEPPALLAIPCNCSAL